MFLRFSSFSGSFLAYAFSRGAMRRFAGQRRAFHRSPVSRDPSAEPGTIFFPSALSSFLPKLVAESSPCKNPPGGAPGDEHRRGKRKGRGFSCERGFTQRLGFVSTSPLTKQNSSQPPPVFEGGTGTRRNQFLLRFLGPFRSPVELFSGARRRPGSAVSCRNLRAEFAAACAD